MVPVRNFGNLLSPTLHRYSVWVASIETVQVEPSGLLYPHKCSAVPTLFMSCAECNGSEWAGNADAERSIKFITEIG